MISEPLVVKEITHHTKLKIQRSIIRSIKQRQFSLIRSRKDIQPLQVHRTIREVSQQEQFTTFIQHKS